MLGAILGDIIGSPFERDGGDKVIDFPLFSKYSRFTDDTVMTFAIFDGLLHSGFDNPSLDKISNNMTLFCQKWGRKYPNAGYGGSFYRWIFSDSPIPYNSFGNGSAMRVSSIGWLFDSIERTREIACISASITHNHKEGIKGAESVASAIYLARNGKTKKEIKEYIEKEFNYNLETPIDKIRPSYSFDVTCQGSVPEAIRCFLEGKSYEDVVRLAVSLGGDTDTQGAIAGSIAEAYYDIPDTLKEKCEEYLEDDMKKLLLKFNEVKKERVIKSIKK